MGFGIGIHSLVLLALTLAPASLANLIHTASPVVDLRYARYQDIYKDTYDIKIFKGWEIKSTL
jgi:hypothetical protein